MNKLFDTGSIVDESQMHYPKWKKSDSNTVELMPFTWHSGECKTRDGEDT